MAGQTQQIWVIIESDGGSDFDIMNDHGLEQLVNFSTRERNNLD